MKIEPETTAIFSGRFDPPHLGHVMTIIGLCERFGRVIIPVLKYNEREVCSAVEAKNIFDFMFSEMSPIHSISCKPEIIVNAVHFGEVTKEYYDQFLKQYKILQEHCVYVSGNPEVLDHMATLDVRCEYLPRSRDDIYEGTKIRKYLDGDDEADNYKTPKSWKIDDSWGQNG